jgi:cation diffusion facilitator CzcD-associated flavoprotein CzcO
VTSAEGIDAASRDALRARYARERERRLAGSRADVEALDGALRRYLDDPHTRVTPRPPVEETTEVLIIGAGMAGLVVSAQLRRAGIRHTRLVDAAGDVGGVWYWNRYPGAMCDVESLVYLPLLEELGYVPRDRYAKAAEIWAYLRALADRFGLYDGALFHTRVVDLVWSESEPRWTATTDRGDRLRARFVVIANGPLSMPKLPAVPGIEDMTCHSFHTSRWDYAYTGGDPDSPLDGLRDKVVGVVGTGATAVQCIPPLAASARRLLVFQRTPSTIAPRDNRPLDPEQVRSWEPGWQWRRIENFSAVLNGLPVEDDLVRDGWTDLYRAVLFRPGYAALEGAALAEARSEADLMRMAQIRDRIDRVVLRPEVAETLKPYYDYFCKRPCFHDEYLPTFNRDNVTLVDASAGGIEAIDGDRVRVAGSDYRVDCLVFATGFEWNTSFVHKIGFDPVGRDGIPLSARWADGVRTLHGIMTAGFPNLYVVPGPNAQSVVTENFGHSIQENAQHIAYVVSEVLRRGHTVADLSPEAERAWVEEVLRRRRDDAAFLEACTPGRSNSEGRPEARPRANANFGGDVFEFFGLLAQWRAEGDLRGLTLS